MEIVDISSLHPICLPLYSTPPDYLNIQFETRCMVMDHCGESPIPALILGILLFFMAAARLFLQVKK